MILQPYWTFLIIIFTLFLIYYNTTDPINLNTEKLNKESTTIKTIIAYSLNKQIELESEEYFCDGHTFEQVNWHNLGRQQSKFWNKVDGSQFYVTSVTLDKRLKPHHYLRIIGVVKGSWNHTIYCQFLTDDARIRITKSTVTPIWYEKWDTNDNNTYYNPTLASCRLPVPGKSRIAMEVSLSLVPCTLSNYFHKIVVPGNKPMVDFTVCVKPLDFTKEISYRLVQWIEICRILGADYFYIFIKNVTTNTRSILEWYMNKYPKLIHIEDFKPLEHEYQNCSTKTFFYNTWQRRRYEIVAYNKCFNSKLNSKYIVPLDIDEIIVPKTMKYWRELVNKYYNNYSSLVVQNTYFFTKNSYSNKPFFFREKWRNKVPSKKGENGKSFVSTENALTVFNHYALHLLRPGVMKAYFLPFRDAQLNHYKESCNNVIFPECTEYQSSPTVADNIIDKYKMEFGERYRKILRRLKNDRIKLL